MAARSLTVLYGNVLVDGVFAFLEKQVPWATPLLEKIRVLIDGNLPALHKYQTAKGLSEISPANVQQFVDSMFALAATLESGNLFLVAALQSLNAFVDAALLPQLIAYLESIGVVTP